MALRGKARSAPARAHSSPCSFRRRWLIVGPILGAVVGELVAGRSFRDGGKAGVGTIVGGILAFALKFGLSVCVVALFTWGLLVR